MLVYDLFMLKNCLRQPLFWSKQYWCSGQVLYTFEGGICSGHSLILSKRDALDCIDHATSYSRNWNVLVFCPIGHALFWVLTVKSATGRLCTYSAKVSSSMCKPTWECDLRSLDSIRLVVSQSLKGELPRLKGPQYICLASSRAVRQTSRTCSSLTLPGPRLVRTLSIAGRKNF